MASLTGMAFQVDFLLGRGSKANTVSGVRDTVDQINLIARQGANKSSQERQKKLEEDLNVLQKLSERSSQRLVKGREAAAKSAAAGAGKTSAALTRKAKADTSDLDAVAKKTKSVANEMKSAFKGLNKELEARGGQKKLAGESFASAKATADFVSREREERQEIVDILQKNVDLKRQAGTLTEGDVLQLQTAKGLQRDINNLEDQDLATQKRLSELGDKAHKDFIEQSRLEEQHLREMTILRQQAGQQISNISTQVGTTLRNAFVYSTAAVAAFYYKLNDVLSTFREFENELMNAQSIFQTTNDTLYGLSDQIAEFGLNYGVELQNATTGLYQLASAGLSAEDSMTLLNNTLKLSMAVQGDHNTISKLTTQTIFGFGLEMEQSGELVDKFAHAINKSLIEYQDLASAVKFAMPFFVSTGQSVDQLLGSLQVLTNRALEAGIAGRGLRQALAEFAESAEDNTRAFRKMGIEITNTDGTFKQLTEIARDFHDTFGETSTDVELMTTLLEDLNVRGATAFVHLVQNVEEFEGAVGDLQNSAGSAAQMAEIQNQSLNNQIQILKNALMAPFIITDEIGRANGFMNEFHMTLHNMVQTFSDLIYTVGPDGEKVLTDLGKGMKEFVIESFKQLTVLLHQAAAIFKSMAGNVKTTKAMFAMILVPLKVMAGILNALGPSGMQFVLMWKTLNGLLPISTLMLGQATLAEISHKMATDAGNLSLINKRNALVAVAMAQMVAYAGMGLMVYATMQLAEGNTALATTFSMLGGAIMMTAISWQALKAAQAGPIAFAAAAAAGAAIGYAYIKMMAKAVKPPTMPPVQELDMKGGAAGAGGGPDPTQQYGGAVTADTGMTMTRTYDTGGGPTANHQLAYVEPGETITSKTMNALGGAGGVTINVKGDVWDEDKFVEKVGDALGGPAQRIMINRGIV